MASTKPSKAPDPRFNPKASAAYKKVARQSLRAFLSPKRRSGKTSKGTEG